MTISSEKKPFIVEEFSVEFIDVPGRSTYIKQEQVLGIYFLKCGQAHELCSCSTTCEYTVDFKVLLFNQNLDRDLLLQNFAAIDDTDMSRYSSVFKTISFLC
jgi:hypothetical protein